MRLRYFKCTLNNDIGFKKYISGFSVDKKKSKQSWENWENERKGKSGRRVFRREKRPRRMRIIYNF